MDRGGGALGRHWPRRDVSLTMMHAPVAVLTWDFCKEACLGFKPIVELAAKYTTILAVEMVGILPNITFGRCGSVRSGSLFYGRFHFENQRCGNSL